MRKDAPFAVEVPSPDRDSPGWVKVGVIAAVGFVIGVAWPRVMGVKLGPNAPGEAAAAAASAAASAKAAGRAPEAPPASVNAKSGVAGAPGSSAASASGATSAPGLGALAASATVPAGPPQVSVQRGSVIACKTTDGESKKGKECGTLAGLDNVVPPHLRKLATCSAADGQTGKLSFVATAAFPSGGLSWDVGKSSTVGNIEGITNCLKTHFSGVTATGVAHEHNRYTVAYNVTFAPPLEASSSKTDKIDKAAKDGAMPAPDADKNAKDGSDKADAPPAAAGSEASVGWEVALVRDVPKTGGVVARLPRGTKVKLGAIKDGWYAIKYGDGFASDGFVYRGAIGR
jgi:hypothetical protein